MHKQCLQLSLLGSAQRVQTKIPSLFFFWKELDCMLSQLLPGCPALISLHVGSDWYPPGSLKELVDTSSAISSHELYYKLAGKDI